MAIDIKEPAVRAPWPPGLGRHRDGHRGPGYESGEPLPKNERGVWIGANLFKKPDTPSSAPAQ